MKRLLRFLRLYSANQALADEMREHVREKAEDLVDSGMERAEAEAAARRDFGNMTLLAERSRDEWGFGFVQRLAQDLRYALRSLRKEPLFAALVIVPLALGIGSNTAIFTAVHAALIRPLPYHQPDQLFQLREANPKFFSSQSRHTRIFRTGVSEPNLRSFAASGRWRFVKRKAATNWCRRPG